MSKLSKVSGCLRRFACVALMMQFSGQFVCGQAADTNTEDGQDTDGVRHVVVLQGQSMRAWTSVEGHQTAARLCSVDLDLDAAEFVKPDGGHVLRMRLARLSETDREHIAEVVAATQTSRLSEAVRTPAQFIAIAKEIGAKEVGDRALPEIKTAIVNGLKQEHQALVGYLPGCAEQAIARCKQLGLLVKENYGIGYFLICSWPDGKDLSAAYDGLAADPKIRYIQPNWTIEIPPGEKPQGRPPGGQKPRQARSFPELHAPVSNDISGRPDNHLETRHGVPGTLAAVGAMRPVGWRHNKQSMPPTCLHVPSVPVSPHFDLTPNDPFFDFLWGMKAINAPRAWQCRRTASILVAVVDTGVDPEHEDLKQNLWKNPSEIPADGLDNDGNGVIDDIFGYNAILNNGNIYDDVGHGTHCSGIIGAVGNNKIGVVGVNWRIKLMAVKFMKPNGAGGASGSDADSIKAIDYAWRNGARIISASWGSASGRVAEQALHDAVARAEAAGVLFVAAAGNDHSDNDVAPFYPSSFADSQDIQGQLGNVISVAAIDENYQPANFSNFGKRSVLLAAPGVNVLSTVPSWDGNYAFESGTSMATPHVAGAFALAWSDPRYASFSLREIKGLVLSRSQRRLQLYDKVATGGTLDLGFLCPVAPCNRTAPDPCDDPCLFRK